MKPASNNAPVFALDETSGWEDLDNAIAASAEYQSSKLGKIIPLMFFAPMTEPDNLDAWEPLQTLPQNLFITSIERSTDAIVIQALDQAEAELGELRFSAYCPAVCIDFDEPFADVYQQMAAAHIAAFAHTSPGNDDASFFFLRGSAAVRAFHRALREVTAK
jgi:hypothetical protein